MHPGGETFSRADLQFMRRALALAGRGYGGTSPNPLVGAVLVRDGRIIGEGWHKRAGGPHAEVNALAAAGRAEENLRDSSLYVTLEPCCTFGRTPPCTDAIVRSGIKEVIVAAIDPNPRHAGEGLRRLRQSGVKVRQGVLATEANRLNEAFNFSITERRPWVIAKCAMSLDGKIATNSGESKWITGPKARQFGMRLRLGADAIVAGVNTVLRDDPALTLRPVPGVKVPPWKELKRVVLDPEARIPETARVLSEDEACLTTVVVSERARRERIKQLEKRARVWVAPLLRSRREMNLAWVMKRLFADGVTSLLVEGGGETHFRLLRQGLVNRVYFFYAPLILTGRTAPKGVAGDRSLRRGKGLKLREVEWTRIGPDLLCSGLVEA